MDPSARGPAMARATERAKIASSLVKPEEQH